METSIQLVNGYKLERKLGSGAFGKAYLASSTREQNANVSMKCVAKMFDNSLFDAKAFASYETEWNKLIKANENNGHPSILKFLDHFEANSIFYIVTEYCEVCSFLCFLRE